MAFISASYFSSDVLEEGPECDEPYALYNVGGASRIRLVSAGPSAPVYKNNGGTPVGTVERGTVLELDTASGDVFHCCEPIFSLGELGNSDVALQPEYLAAKTLCCTASRYSSVQIKLYSISATTADIYRNGALVTTLTLTPGSVSVFTQGNPYVGNWRVDADGLVLGFKTASSGGDSCVMVEPALSIIGWASTGAYVAKESGSSTAEAYKAYGHYASLSDTLATSYDLINSPDLGQTTNQARYYLPGAAFVATGDGIRLHGNSRADSDGGNDTALIPVELMRCFHKLPQPCEFVGINCLSATPIEVRDPLGVLITTLTPTKVNADLEAPFSAYYGSANGQSNIPIGTEFYCSEPIQVVYQTKGGGAYGSDDDEANSWGYDIEP